MQGFKDAFYPLLKLAMPLALTGLIQSAVWFFETIFLAHLGPDILAAGALVSWLYGTIVVILYGTLSSINILVAHKHGAKDESGILPIVRDGFWLAILFALPLFLLFWNITYLFSFFGHSQSIIFYAEAYLHAMAWGILPNVVVIALMEVIIGLGHARQILVFSMLSVSFTIFFCYTLIFGKVGFPALGIAGAGWGLTISNWITVCFLSSYVALNSNYRRYFTMLLVPKKPFFFLELLHVGAPIGMMYCIEVAFFFVLTLLMGNFGSLMMAANQIALQYMGSLMQIIFSIAQAITVRMGHLLGAGDKYAAERTSYVGIVISGVLMFLISFWFWFWPTSLISLDFDVHNPQNEKLVQFARQLLMVCAVFQIFEGIRIALFGTLRALRDTRFTLFISTLSFWGIALPVGYFLACQTSLGGSGLWWGMVLGAATSVGLLMWRFRIKIRQA